MTSNALSRRSFLVMSAMLPFALRTNATAQVPVGLELYSVRNGLKQDLTGKERRDKAFEVMAASYLRMNGISSSG